MPLTQGSRTHGEVTSRDNDVPYLVKANMITVAQNTDICFKLKNKKERNERELVWKTSLSSRFLVGEEALRA